MTDRTNKNQCTGDENRIRLFKKRRKRSQFELAMLSVTGILGFIILWQLSVSMNIVNTKFLASPLEIFNLFLVKLTDPRPDGNVLGVNILSSLQVSLTGFGIAVLTAVPIGLLMGWYKGFERFMRPIFEIIRPIPPIAWIPMIIIWLGIGLKAKAFIVFFSAFVPCVINSYTGIQQTSEVLVNVGKTCGTPNFIIFLKIGLPSSLAMVFAGVKVALGNAWSTLVAAEMLAASSGLGYMILMGRQFARPDIILLGIVVIAVIGSLFMALLELLESKVLRWKRI